ncbi:hypothetical protein ALUC_81225S [Aspergillus luchuensis]|nr:hypothetical protein ALUC_81225S [Aspergillus luchuensis]
MNPATAPMKYPIYSTKTANFFHHVSLTLSGFSASMISLNPDHERGDTDIRGEEVTRGPLGRKEAGESIDQSEEGRARQTNVHSPWLHAR